VHCYTYSFNYAILQVKGSGVIELQLSLIPSEDMLSILEAAVESYSNGDTETAGESSVSLQVTSDSPSIMSNFLTAAAVVVRQCERSSVTCMSRCVVCAYKL
jgi:hypothetical protein